MPSLSLKIILDEGAVTRKVKFDTRMTVREAHKVVKEKVIVPNDGKEYALFLRSADNETSGVWLEDGRTLDYYMLRDGDSLDYICRVRNLRIRLLDDTVKTLQVDEAKTVGELMINVCERIGLTNYDEYGLCHEEDEETDDGKESKEPATGTLTLKRKQQPKERDVVLEQMSKKLKTDDNVEWLDQHRTLREQGIVSKETLLLKRRLFFSDRNVDSRDPVQLNLLYVQTRDAILNGRHPVTEQQAVEFAGIQCQVHFGDYQEKKHKPGFLENLQEYLPEQYSNAWGVEKKIFKAYSQHQGVSPLDAKFLYIKTARALPTYGVTFFLVKEKQKDKKKLVPRLLGINAEAILRLDENTKEILQQWPLTHVKMYHAGKSQTFTLNFGDYSDKEYSVKTQDCHRIRDILEGYIDIIRRRMLAKPTASPGESMAICQDNVEVGKSHLIEHVSNNPSKIVTETFVGPNRILPYDQASQAQSGAMFTTVQQIVVTDHLQNQQQAFKGEIPLRGDMSKDCIKKLNRLNSNSVKIVGLLTDPTDVHIKDAQKIVETMQEDLPVVQKGVKETAEMQSPDGAKMLLDELDDLLKLMHELSDSTKPGHVNPSDAKTAAESIADLTTQMYFSIDPKTRRRSDLLRRSRKSFKSGEESEASIRRASFIAAATTALHSVDNATHALNEEYTGPKLDDAQRKKLEKSLEDRMGKLNAAIALYLTAHSDPNNIDYPAAINSMNAIKELMPKLARDAQILGSTMDPAGRKELQDEMRKLFDATKKVGGLTGFEDHEKMQEASNNYADIAGKLIFTFARGSNADKENEIIDLAKDAGDKTSILLVTANELTCQTSAEPAAATLHQAGRRTAGAARDLLACAQLTAPAIHEPHCQSALTAAAEGLSSSVHHMESTWRPLVEDPTRQHMAEPLRGRAMDVMKALQRLKDAYASLVPKPAVPNKKPAVPVRDPKHTVAHAVPPPKVNAVTQDFLHTLRYEESQGADDTDDALPLQERQRLKFIATKSGAKNMLQGAEELWSKLSATNTPSEEERVQAQRRLEQQMAQLNAAIAALAAATADRENPDFATAELAMSTINELMPQIVRDAELASSNEDEATRNAIRKHIIALCDATSKMCEGEGYQHGQGEAASDFAAASRKLIFLVSPGADKGKEKYMAELSSIAHDKATELVTQAQHLRQHMEPHAAAELDTRVARVDDAALALVSIAQVTAASISESRCQDALSSAVDRLHNTAAELTSSCQKQLPAAELQQEKAALVNTQQHLDDSLRKLAELCQTVPGNQGYQGDGVSGQQEKQRLQFINSVSGAKKRLDAAEQLLNKPHACQMMREEDAAALEHRLSERLAQLNAAVAALTAATADREHPDYAAADQAVDTITELMSPLIQDSRTLCSTKNNADQAEMLRDLRALCDATRELCDTAGQPQGVGDAAAKFSAASSKLVFLVSPRDDNELENQVIDLSATAVGKTSELLSQVQGLTQQVEPHAAAELDSRGACVADAAQALLTIAQVTAPSISEPICQNQLVSAAERLRTAASDLGSSCAPHLQQRPDMQKEVLSSQQQLNDSLDRLVNTCRSTKPMRPGDVSAQQEKQRLKFVSSMSGAKNRLYDAEYNLNQPMMSQPLQQQEASVLQHRLSQRLAQLNAALAALTAATADREHPDYVAAEQAIKNISELMPQVVQDSRKLCGTKDEAGQAAMLQDLKALCEATRELCENADKGVGDAAAKFSAASGKLVFLVSPRDDDAQEKQVMALSAAACGKTSELLSQVQGLTQQVEPHAAAELDSRGACVADAAQALLTIAQATSPTISEPSCSSALVSAAEKLRTAASDLGSSCAPHLQQRPDMQKEVLNTQQQLNEGLDRLVHACRAAKSVRPGDVSAQKEKQRLRFVNSMSGAKNRLNDTEHNLNQPIKSQSMKQEDASVLQHRLSQRLAQLNAALAALTAATADRENPDYLAAERAIKDISELMPHIVQDSRTLCGTKDEAGQADMLHELRALCEATRELCDNADKGVGDAAAKFSAASGKLVFLISPTANDAQEKQVMALSAAACGKTSELLSQVQGLTQQVEPRVAAELDTCGAHVADAAQALLTIAQTTSPTISEPSCSSALVSAAEKLRTAASDLGSSCAPHLQQRPDMQKEVLNTQQQLNDSLDRLVHACKTAQHGSDITLSPQQEKQRLKFVSSVSGAKNSLDVVEQQMKEPILCQLMNAEDGAALQRNLSERLAQLNAAIAALNAATADGKNPDYAAAERAVHTITELMPQIVQDSRSVCGTKDEAGQADMLHELRALCEATRELCDSKGHPQKLHDASTKLGNASRKLVFVVGPQQPTRQVRDVSAQGPKPAVSNKKPAVPVRDPKHTVAHAVPPPKVSAVTQDFLHTLRCEESQEKPTGLVATNVKDSSAAPDTDSCARNTFSQVVDNTELEMHTAKEGLKVLYKGRSPSVVGGGTAAPAQEVARCDQHVEEVLAQAAVQLANIVAANYADKLDYKAAMEPTIALTKSVKSVVYDGSVISGSLNEDARKPFLDDLVGLCDATRNICEAAKSQKEKLNDAAISFGDRSANLLRVVGSDVNPELEKEVISRAKAIGDTASRLALEASNVASSTSSDQQGGSHVQDICTAGARCVDAAGKLVYTAKLVAPSIHHSTCQDALVSSADSLSSSLTSFSKTWAPLASAQHPNVQKLTEEAENLEKLVEKLRGDVRAGKLGKRREVDWYMDLNTPLRKMTMQVIDNADKMAEYGEISAELKKEYKNYSSRLAEAIRALDLANARYHRAPHDKKKRNDMEIATQDLQMTLLQTRPSRAGQQQNNIVDFRDFLQDLVNEADKLQETAKKNEGPAGKRVTDDIQLLCSKISEDATKLLNPEHQADGVTVMSSVDDIEDIDHFGHECDALVKEINALIQDVHDQKAKQALRAKALPLTESCHLLRFATNSHISATNSVAFEEVLRDLDNFKTSVMKPLVNDRVNKPKKDKKVFVPVVAARTARASSSLLRATASAVAGEPEVLCQKLTYYAAASANQYEQKIEKDEIGTNLSYIASTLEDITGIACLRASNFEYRTKSVTEKSQFTILKSLHDLDEKITARKIEIQVLNAEDIDKLLLCEAHKVEGTPQQLQHKLQQLSTKLSCTSGTIVQSVRSRASLSRSLHAAADVTAQLANTARALKDSKRPGQCKKIENAAHEMCLATYSLLKTSELVCHDPNHHDSRRKMMEACNHLNDSINKLVRSVNPAGKVSQECGEVQRSLQLRRSVLQAGPQPCGAAHYAHCLDTLRDQGDVLHKLNNDQAMSRAQFLQSMHYVTSAVTNSAECAAHAAYLLSVSEKDESIGKEGIVDVSKLHKVVGAVEDTCVSIIRAQHDEQIQEQSKVLESDVKELVESLDDAVKKTKDKELKDMLTECRQDINESSRTFFDCVKNQQIDKQQTISLVMDLMDHVHDADNLLEHPDLVPTATKVSADTQAKIDEVVNSSLALLTNTDDLIKQVKSAPEEEEMMKWVMFNKRKDVLDAFDALLKSVKSTGQRSNILEIETEDPEEEKKSYVQKQFDTASKWLLKSISKAEVKTNGQQAVRNLIDVATKITEDLKGNDKEDMRNLVIETEQLLKECSQKYDQEQYSVLMERVRELKKGIERGVVTRVVEDFMEAEAPLADLDIIADHEKDESKRKFLLEQKIADLLAHLSRVTKTARLIASTDKDSGTAIGTQLNTCSEQAELLAPMLVKAAQQRVASPDDKAVIENYQALIAKYAESLSKIRDLCDQSVDPMEFVQTAGETMQRMREESTKHNDPMKCAQTSAAITELANRVIHVSMSSNTVRNDPELQKALTEAQQQLTAATPPADTRASRMPDWKDTTAKILQATEEVESLLGGETIFKNQPAGPNQPIYNEALNLHVAIRDWSSRDNEIVAVAKRMAVLMAKLSNYMNNDKQREVLATSKSIVLESHEVTRLAKKLAHECTDHRIKTNLLQTCERIPTISGQLKMLTTVKGFALGRHGMEEDKEAMDMLVGNAQSLMLSIQDVVKGAASASVKIMSQRGPRMKWVRKTIY